MQLIVKFIIPVQVVFIFLRASGNMNGFIGINDIPERTNVVILVTLLWCRSLIHVILMMYFDFGTRSV